MADIITGKRAVVEALRSSIRIDMVYVLDNMRHKEEFIQEIKVILRRTKIHIKEVSRKELASISNTEKHGGVAAKVEGKSFVTIEQIIRNAQEKQEEPFIILLNGIEDPHNFGAILRSAEGAGVHGVIIPKRRTAPIGATVAKTSAGALYHIPIAKVANIAQAVRKLKENGLWVVGSDVSSNKMYYEVDYTIPTAIILGSEGKGMQDIVRKNCDSVVKIPMIGNVQSLNASVSSGILCYEVVKQRLQKI